MSRAFFRRNLPCGEADPATRFGRWLKENPALFFDHPDRSYRYVARAVQEALRNRRAVILILVDALGIHVAPQAIAYLSDKLGTQPTRTSYVFTPLPTVSEVCKEAILTGQFPSDCRGNLAQGLLAAFGLEEGQLQIASNWHDADRLPVRKQTKLLVYRDNRLDDRLKTVRSYRVLIEECPSIFSRMARLIQRWADDLRLLNDNRPFVILAADQGFTFGPPPGSETSSHRKLDGTHRCIEVADRLTEGEAKDEFLTFIDKDVFHLRTSYLAARGRYFGQGTVSGWALSHGGLLPEEVIVPAVEWFGEEVSVPWPEVSIPDDALRDRSNWILHVVLVNRNPVPVPAGTLRVSVAGEKSQVTQAIPRLESGATHEVTVTIPSPSMFDSQMVPFEVVFSVRTADGIVERPRRVEVRRAVQLVERTEEQARFEQMFQ